MEKRHQRNERNSFQSQYHRKPAKKDKKLPQQHGHNVYEWLDSAKSDATY